MCGISGFVNRDRERPADEALLRRMTEAIAHRGPDGSGSFVEGPVALGHRRLSIIDLSSNGAQPMHNEDGAVTVTFNGEIYNYLTLRDELIARGHAFRSRCDTEVLVHGYEEWGDALPERLNGMFAFAIYDRAKRKLFLSRDRFGKKPLYYFAGQGCFAFASELTALLEHPGVPREIDESALRKYFAYGFIPAPHSLYRNIAKLPGGHSLGWDIEAGTATRTRY